MTKEEIKKYRKEYYQKHKKELTEYAKNAYDKNKEEKKERMKQYYLSKKEYFKSKNKKYYLENTEKVKEYSKKRYNTPIGRASALLKSYNKQDIEMGRGKGNLTAKWIVDNIFSQPCAHCGKTGWENIGCNRINNDLPHTKDNVEPCCFECNVKLARKTI